MIANYLTPVRMPNEPLEAYRQRLKSGRQVVASMQAGRSMWDSARRGNYQRFKLKGSA